MSWEVTAAQLIEGRQRRIGSRPRQRVESASDPHHQCIGHGASRPAKDSRTRPRLAVHALRKRCTDLSCQGRSRSNTEGRLRPKSFTNRVFVRGRHVLKLALIAVHK